VAKIAYLGPTDPDDKSRVYRLPGDPDVVLPIGVEVEVTPAQKKALDGDADHKFGKATEADAGEPFSGYSDLNADEVVKALGDPKRVPTLEAAQAVLDFEKDHDDRKTVTEAAAHQVEAFAAAAGDTSNESGDSGEVS
jgi:hypothetical protein